MRKWLILLCTLLFLAPVLLWSYQRADGLNERQKQDFALMAMPDEPSGQNAFPVLWLLGYRVPEDDWEAVIAADVIRWRNRPPSFFPRHQGDDPMPATMAGERYPQQSITAEQVERFCHPNRENCLRKVEQAPARYRSLVNAAAPILHRLERLREADYYRSPLPYRHDAPQPPLQLGLWPITGHALAFIEGNVDMAFADACADLAAWRRIARHSDSLFVQRLASSIAGRGYGRFLADMLAEVPADYRLPSSCTEALRAPAEDELSFCRAAVGDYATLTTTAEQLRKSSEQDGWPAWMVSLVYQPEKTRADLAWPLARVCRASQGKPRQDAMPLSRFGAKPFYRWNCIDNLLGCRIAAQGLPDYAGYLPRLVDRMAQLELLASIVWLRDNQQARMAVATLLGQRPASLRRSGREVRVSEDGHYLEVEQQVGGPYRLPLPDSR
jgi:hypothetical protein